MRIYHPKRGHFGNMHYQIRRFWGISDIWAYKGAAYMPLYVDIVGQKPQSGQPYGHIGGYVPYVLPTYIPYIRHIQASWESLDIWGGCGNIPYIPYIRHIPYIRIIRANGRAGGLGRRCVCPDIRYISRKFGNTVY